MIDLIQIMISSLLLLLYVWVSYNLPILFIGVRRIRRRRLRQDLPNDQIYDNLPSVSIIIPVKDEERVIGRLLKALLKIDYPKDKYEVIMLRMDQPTELERYAKGLPRNIQGILSSFIGRSLMVSPQP